MPPNVHRVLAIRRLTDETFVLRFTREGLAFRAGQHVTLAVPGQDAEREYSVYSGERDPDLEVLVREVPAGVVSPRLGACRPGDPLHVRGPGGVFVLAPDHLAPRGSGRPPLLFVATGTGIAPYHAMFRTHPDLAAQVVHGVRLPEEAYGRADFPSDRHVLCTTRGGPPDARTGVDFAGRVTDWLRANPPAPDTPVFLCGNAAMIDEAYELLVDLGVPPLGISTEIYF